MMETLSPLEIARGWYRESDIARAITNNNRRYPDPVLCVIPEDIHSPEFAKWLTNQYQLAMAKGIEIGRRSSKCQTS